MEIDAFECHFESVPGVSDPVSIDAAWTRGTGAPRGPMQIFDVVGIKTAYHIVMQYQKVPGILSPLLRKMMMPCNFKAMEKVLREMVDAACQDTFEKTYLS